MRATDGISDTLTYLHGDHGSSPNGEFLRLHQPGHVRQRGLVSRQLYTPYGEVRYAEGALPTDYGFTGQRNEADLGLYDYVARFYDPSLNRWISPDTIVPDPANPQSLNRYAYTYNNPLKYTDPSGHDPKKDPPPPELPLVTQQAIDFFSAQGWQVVGDPSLIDPNANGADLVFTMQVGETLRVLAVELKDVVGKIDKGTLGLAGGDYGGSISRVARSATRFINSSNEQLRLMSETVVAGRDAGTLENALFTSDKATSISQGAQDVFNSVYRVAENGEVIVEKAIDNADEAAAGGATARTFWQVFKSWLLAAASAPTPPFILIPRCLLPDYTYEEMQG